MHFLQYFVLLPFGLSALVRWSRWARDYFFSQDWIPPLLSGSTSILSTFPAEEGPRAGCLVWKKQTGKRRQSPGVRQQCAVRETCRVCLHPPRRSDWGWQRNSPSGLQLLQTSCWLQWSKAAGQKTENWEPGLGSVMLMVKVIMWVH